MKKKRCGWSESSELMRKYHDAEWGVPLHDDKRLFEFLVLEGVQAGLSWSTVLNKRENYRKALDNFNYKKIAKYTDKKIESLLQNAGLIRNRLKMNALVINAKCFINVQKEFGSFEKYLWSFVNNKPIVNKFKSLNETPTKTLLSDKISEDMKKRGFKFVGSTIIYAYMQATGMVNDHLISCFRKNHVFEKK